VAVFSGVLEYVQEPAAVINWLRASGVHTFVLSFDGVPDDAGWYARVQERRRRLQCGYMNNLTYPQLLAHLSEAGLVCEEEHAWTRQRLYRFVRT
jgi:hypothetical protein